MLIRCLKVQDDNLPHVKLMMETSGVMYPLQNDREVQVTG